MRISTSFVRATATALFLFSATACSSVGGLGSILGSVLGSGAGGGGQSNQVSGTVQGVDTRNQQIGIQQSNGQTVAVSYDNQTQVRYQDQNYSVSSLERGDQVTLRIQQLQNGGYYTDVVQVDRSVSGSGTMQSGNVQLIEGTVRQIDQANGVFLLDASNRGRLTVQLGQQLSRNDLDRFRRLRVGEYARLYGVYLGNSRVELRQFN